MQIEFRKKYLNGLVCSRIGLFSSFYFKENFSGNTIGSIEK